MIQCYDSIQINAVLTICPVCLRAFYMTHPGICRDCTGIVAIGVSR